MDYTEPLGIFLVKSGSKGDRLLFKYPLTVKESAATDRKNVNARTNAYAMEGSEDFHNVKVEPLSNVRHGQVYGLSDKDLSSLFAVKNELCKKKFEMKINDVRFVGHPCLLYSDKDNGQIWSSPSPSRDLTAKSTANMFNIVFALRANACHSIVNCYHDFSQRLVVSLRHEELRCGFLNNEIKLMLSAHDDVVNMSEACKESPFKIILEKSQLAQDLRTVFQDLVDKGEVHLKINKWIEVSFCLPHKVHRLKNMHITILPEAIQKCLAALRPYHGMLLLEEKKALLDSLPLDASPTLVRLIWISTPVKCLQALAADSDITLTQVFQLVGHLVYWAKATVIYPLCESNVYILSPNAPSLITSPLMSAFSERFPDLHLLNLMSDFSLPTSLSQWGNPKIPQSQSQQVQIIVWMLQHRLLIQLHTYIYIVAGNSSTSLIQSPNDLQVMKITQSESEAGSVTSEDYNENLTQSSNNLSMSVDSSLTSPMDNETRSMNTSDLHMHKALAKFSFTEREAILQVPAASKHDDLATFVRLLPYFQGQHHLEEIMYYQNIRRSQLLALLDKFCDILITCQHEDVAVAAFYRTSGVS